MQSEERRCNMCKNQFTLEPDDFSFYDKMKVPAPNVCPDCRFKMRAQWRNEMSLYSCKCAKTGKQIISNFNPKSPYTVVSNEYYYSDDWDAKDFAIKYDINIPFFNQFKELFLNVFKPATYIPLIDGQNINSEYSNYASGLRNCYMAFNTGPAEEVLYSRGVRNSREIVDCYYVNESSELMYECVNCTKSSKIIYGRNINSCVDCCFITNASGCMNCFGCVNIRNATNKIFNKQYSKDEYDKTILEILGNYEKFKEFKKKFMEFEKEFPMRANHNLKSINSTGDYLVECKSVNDSFENIKSEDCRYIFSCKGIKDSYGVIGYGYNSERLLECVSMGYSSNIIGGVTTTDCQDVLYSYSLQNCQDCIGCDGLKNSKYCILNMQYEKEEYKKLKEHIIKELIELGIYGLMMPIEIVPFAYNETLAQDNMPLTEEEALSGGFRWEDNLQKTEGKETMKIEDISNNIMDVKDEITKEVLKCINCGRNFKIIGQELLFYRKMTLPIPRKCFYCRHKDRISRRGEYKFFTRKCSNCNLDTFTNLTEEVAPIMYCEKCYQQEVV